MILAVLRSDFDDVRAPLLGTATHPNVERFDGFRSRMTKSSSAQSSLDSLTRATSWVGLMNLSATTRMIIIVTV